MLVLENTHGAAPLCLVGEREVREGGPLPPALAAYHAELDQVVNWAHAYLCEPHPQLGRDGPVCPYARSSLEQGFFWLAVHAASDPYEDEVADVVRAYRRWFEHLQPVEGRATEYKAIVILFPALVAEDAPTLLDAVQAALKPEFVDEGLMISQFHSACAEVGRWNRRFHPLRSDVPLLTIRTMVRTDAPFLVADPRWLSAYLRYFGDDVPARFQPAVTRAAHVFGVASTGA